MADARSIRAILYGSVTAGPYIGEIWQTGMSFVEGDAGGVFANAIKESLPTFDVTTIGEVSSDATWDVDWAWKGTSKVTQANQTGMANAALAFWTTLKAECTTELRMDGLKLSAIDAGGHVINGGNYFSLKTPLAGVLAVSQTLPAQICVVASLKTGARGPGGRGRMYLPLNACKGPTGLVGASALTAVKTGTKNYAEAVRAIGPLASVVNAGPVTYSALKTVEVGNMFDTQRRRRNAANEVYTSQAITL